MIGLLFSHSMKLSVKLWTPLKPRPKRNTSEVSETQYLFQDSHNVAGFMVGIGWVWHKFIKIVTTCCVSCLVVPGTLIATWRERGCNSFWKVIKQFPFLRSHIVGWKACFVIHRIFRDGHPDVSNGQLNNMYMYRVWTSLSLCWKDVFPCFEGNSFIHCDSLVSSPGQSQLFNVSISAAT